MCDGRGFLRVERYSGLLLFGKVGEARTAAVTSREAWTEACRVGFLRQWVERGGGVFTEQPAATVGNYRRRWCIQPIGY